jgi:hypothetical protein
MQPLELPSELTCRDSLIALLRERFKDAKIESEYTRAAEAPS